MEKTKRTQRSSHVGQQLTYVFVLIIAGAIVDAPICIAVLLTQESTQQKMAQAVQVPIPEIKPVEAPVTVAAPEVPVALANCESELIEVALAQDTKPVAVTPAVFQGQKEGDKIPSVAERLEQAAKAVVAAKGASTETAFLAKLEEAKKLTLQIKALTKSNARSEEYQGAKRIYFAAKRLKEQYEQKKSAPKGAVVLASAEGGKAKNQGAGGNQGEQPKSLEEKTASLDSSSTPKSEAKEEQKTAVMTYRGSVKTGFCFGTGENGFQQFFGGTLAVQAKLIDSLTFDGEGTVGISLLNPNEGGDHNPPFVEIRKFSLTYESPSIEGLWVKAGKFESPLFKNPVGGNLLCLHPMGLFAGYGGAGTEGWLGPQFEQLNFVGGLSQDSRLGTIFVGEVSAHTRETEFMGRICTFDLALTSVCSLSQGGWLLNPKAAAHFSLWEGMPAVASAELLIALGETEVQSAIRLGFGVGDVDEFGRLKETGGWMFQFVTTWTLPDECHSVSLSYTATVGTRPLDWLAVAASATLVMEDGGFQNALAVTATAQVTEKLNASVTAEMGQRHSGHASHAANNLQPGVSAWVKYDITDRLGLKKDGFFKTASVEANAFLGESTGVGVTLELEF